MEYPIVIYLHMYINALLSSMSNGVMLTADKNCPPVGMLTTPTGTIDKLS